MTRLLPCIIGVRITSILKIYGMLNTKALYRHCMCVCAEQKDMEWISVSQVVSKRPIDIILWRISVAHDKLAQALKLDSE